MKKYNFLKKVCSVVLAVAMLASLGVTAFANTAATVTIDKVEPKETQTAGVYEVVVEYTVTGTTNIGVTMLTYADKTADGDGLTVTDAYDETTMQIVGIDQKSGNGDGTFTFAVTINNDNNGIKVEYDKPAVVMVGGDNIEAPAAALLTIPTPTAEPVEATAASAEVANGGSVEVYSYQTIEDVLDGLIWTATLKDNAQAEIGTVTVNSTDITSVNNETGAVTATIPETATVTPGEGVSKVNLPVGGLTVTFTVVANTIQWEADTITPVANFEVALADATSADAVLAKLLEKKVTISDSSNAEATATVNITEDMVVAADDNPTDAPAVDDVYTYTVTLNPGADDVYTLAADATGNGFTVTITITEEAEPDVVYGDLTGEGSVGMADVIVLARAVGRWEDYAYVRDMKAADVNDDDSVGMADLIVLRRKVGRWEDYQELPYKQ